jgi:hypothetical protein
MLLIAAAALTLGATAAQAAPAAKDPMCGIGNQANNQSWAEHYNCWGHPAPTKQVAHRPGPARDPMCTVGARANDLSWQEHYRCWK